MIYVLFKTS